jgi:hypothetical protein
MADGTTTQRQLSVTQRFVPGISADPWLRYFPARLTTNGNRLFISQGDLDRACGLYCVVMALMLATRIPRSIAKGMLNETTAQYPVFKRLAKDMYFRGSGGEMLGYLAQAVRPDIKYGVISGGHATVLDQVLSLVARGKAVSLAVHDKTQRYCHWVLVVGIEYVSGSETSARGRLPKALLAVDPGCRAPFLRCFNWRLELDQPKRAARYLRCHDESGVARLVRCLEAMVLGQTVRRLDYE